jgi:hypothetical protein
VWHKYHTNFYCRLTCNGKYTIIGTMMKQQFCSMSKPTMLQATTWLLANGSFNSIPGEPGFWLDYIRISDKNPGTKHSGVFHLVQRQREPVSLKTTNVGGPEDGKSVVKTLMVKIRSIKAFSLVWVHPWRVL